MRTERFIGPNPGDSGRTLPDPEIFKDAAKKKW